MSPCTCSASIRQCMWFTCMNYLLICEGYRRVMQQYYSFTNSEYLWILTSSVQVPAFCRCRYCIVWGCVHIKSQHWLPIQIGMVKKLHEIDIGYGVVTPVKFCVGALIAHSIHKWSSEFGFCMLSRGVAWPKFGGDTRSKKWTFLDTQNCEGGTKGKMWTF